MEQDNLETEYDNLAEAFGNADRLRTIYQIQVEALHDAILGLQQARGRHHTQLAFEALVALREQQRKANQP
jgi:hypothetical protein